MADPQHARIAADIRARIASGELAPGTPVASEADLSTRFEVSRGTVRQALSALRSEGLITGGRGRRPVVARPALSQSFDQMVSFTAWAQRSGRIPGAHTIELARRPCPPELAALLGVAAGGAVYQYKRLRLLDGVPAMLELSTFIEPIGRLLLDFDLDAGSVYQQLGARGVNLAEIDQEISAVPATPELMEMLDLTAGVPVLQVRHHVYDADSVPVELSYDLYRGDIFSVAVHNRIAMPRAGVSLTVAQDRVGAAEPIRPSSTSAA